LHNSTRLTSLHNSTRIMFNGYTISYLYTASNPARPLAALPHTAASHAHDCTTSSPRIAHSPGGSKTPEHPWRGWIKVVNGLALTCEFPIWHSWECPKTGTGAYGNCCTAAHTVHFVNNLNLCLCMCERPCGCLRESVLVSHIERERERERERTESESERERERE
jgi:hypothetical protein